MSIFRGLPLRWFLSVTIGGVSLAGSAATTEWVGPAEGRWETAANWSAGSPGAGLEVTIAGLGSRVVRLDSATPIASLSLTRLTLGPSAGGESRLLLNGPLPGDFNLAGTVTLAEGAVWEVSQARVRVDGAAGGHLNFLAGNLRLAGGVMETANGAVFRVGRAGLALLELTGGSRVGASGDFIVGGFAGSSGVVRLSDGDVRIEGLAILGDDPGSEGRVTVTGGRWTALGGTARVGDDGVGRLEVADGQVAFGDVSVGRAAGAQGFLSLAGGDLTTGDLSLGRFAGARGELRVSGGRLSLTNDTLYVGREGQGSLVVEGGVIEAGEVRFAATNGALAALDFRSGAMKTTRLFADLAATDFHWRAGRWEVQASSVRGGPWVVGDGIGAAELVLGPGLHEFAGGLVISAGAVVRGPGTVVGSLTGLPGGTNALDSVGPPPPVPARLTMVRRGGALVLSFPTEAGFSYAVEASADPDPTRRVWTELAVKSGTGGAVEFVDGAGGLLAPARFYRVGAR